MWDGKLCQISQYHTKPTESENELRIALINVAYYTSREEMEIFLNPFVSFTKIIFPQEKLFSIEELNCQKHMYWFI